MMNAARLSSFLPMLRFVKIKPHRLLHAPFGAIQLVEKAFQNNRIKSAQSYCSLKFIIARWKVEKHPPNTEQIAFCQSCNEIIGNRFKIEGRRVAGVERDDEA